MNIFEIFWNHPLLPFFLVANLAIGYWAHLKAEANSFEDYALASRDLPTGVLIITILSTLVARGDLWQSDYSFKFGVIDYVSFFGWVLAFVLIGTFLAPRLIYFNESITLGDLMKIFYGPIAQIITGVLSCMICLLMISSQIRAVGTITEKISDFEPTYAMFVFGAIVIMYSVLGGMRAVSFTDVFQGIGILCVVILLTHVVAKEAGSLGYIWQQLPVGHRSFFSHKNFFFKTKLSFGRSSQLLHLRLLSCNVC